MRSILFALRYKTQSEWGTGPLFCLSIGPIVKLQILKLSHVDHVIARRSDDSNSIQSNELYTSQCLTQFPG